jgi:D-3-phosphoglycerate dehydrogenase
MTTGEACTADRARVWVGPEPDDIITSAILRGGGQLAPLSDANAVIWLHRQANDLRPILHDAVQWVQLSVAGIESWLGDPILTRGPIFTSARGAYADAVSEHALSLLLAAARQLHEAARSDRWSRLPTRMFRGSTVVIIGAGGIGRALIRDMEPLDVDVVAVTKSGTPVTGATRTLPAARMGEVWSIADYIVLAAPATADTHWLIGAAELAAMRSHAWIVNVARGTLIDSDALVRALREKRIGGAALDVTDPEPLTVEHPLWAEPRCLITSHSANPADARIAGLARRVEENVSRFAVGKPLQEVVDPDTTY